MTRTEHADPARVAARVVALAGRHGVTYSDQEAEDLAEALRLSSVLPSPYVWDDVRTSADARYTLTVERMGGAL